MDIGDWLRSLGLERYEAAFRENEIDETVLPSLTHETLKELGVTAVGHRLKLLDAIAGLRRDGATKPPAADEATTPAAPSITPQDRAERRQVTVMFCDLVGSTALSTSSIPKTCGRSLPLITGAPPKWSSATAASWPSTWATGCWPISAIPRPTSMTPSTRSGPPSRLLRQCRSSPPRLGRPYRCA